MLPKKNPKKVLFSEKNQIVQANIEYCRSRVPLNVIAYVNQGTSSLFKKQSLGSQFTADRNLIVKTLETCVYKFFY